MERWFLSIVLKSQPVLAAKILEDPNMVPTGPDDVENLIKQLSNLLLAVAGISAVVMIIWGAAQYLTAAGDTEKASKGRATLTWALAGLFLILAAFVVVNSFAKILAGVK